MITLTENATKHIKTLQTEQSAPGKALRVYVDAGGCRYEVRDGVR